MAKKKITGPRVTENVRLESGLMERVERYVSQQDMGSRPQAIEKAVKMFLDAEKKAGRFKE